MAKNHILHDYQQLSDGLLGDFALNVASKLGGSTYAASPVVAGDLTSAANGFTAAVGTALTGSPADTLFKNTQRAALIGMLDKIVTFVELVANNDPAIMINAGFSIASTSRSAQVPVGTVSIASVDNAGTGNLKLSLTMGPSVWAIEVQTSVGGAAFQPAGIFTDPRDITVKGLTPGTVYTCHVRVYGSHNQVSDWSDPVSHMAM